MTEHKLSLLQEYLEFTQQMIQILDQPDYEEELFQLFDKRDSIIGRINEIDQGAGRIVKDEAITNLLEQIRIKDLLFTEKLSSLKEEAAQKLQSINQAKKVNNRYVSEYETSDGIFYDKKQ